MNHNLPVAHPSSGELMIDITPYEMCIQDVNPATIQQIINVESKGNILALNVNGTRQPRPARTKEEAIKIAAAFIKQGYSVDMGLMQINSNNLKKYGISLKSVFDPCVNIRTGSQILHNNFDSAIKTNSEPQKALQIALSMYNTGDKWRGFSNGYVSKYTHHPLTVSPSTLDTTIDIDIGDLYDE